MESPTKQEAAVPKEQNKEEQEGHDAHRMTMTTTSTSSSSSSLPAGGAAVIVGGGVAGTAAAAELCSRRPDARVTLVARDDKVKVATNVVRHTKYIETFDVSPVDAVAFAPPNLTIVRGEALGVDLERKVLTVKKVAPATETTTHEIGDGGKAGQREERGGEEGERVTGSTSAPLRLELPFDVLIAATGAVPKRLLPLEDEARKEDDRRIVYLRDAESVAAAAASLRGARRVVVAGNGGIALGLAHALGSSDVAVSPAPSSGEEGGREGTSVGRRPRRRVLWAAKHGHVGDAFFDADAAAFLAKAIGKKRRSKKEEVDKGVDASVAAAAPLPTSLVPPRARTTAAATAAATAPSLSSSSSPASLAFGAAVGPGWVEDMTGAIGIAGEDIEKGEGGAEGGGGGGEGGGGGGEGGGGGGGGCIELHLNATVTSVEENENIGQEGDAEGPPPFPLSVTLSDGSAPFACDAVVAAVGVAPETSWLPSSLERSPRDGGVLVDGGMRSSFGSSLLACGDACTVRDRCHGERWFQMRLWSQALATGAAAGRSAAAVGAGDEGDEGGARRPPSPPLSSPWPHSLELFAHATSVAGLRVILLGLYNGQGLDREPEEDIVTYCREEGGEGGEGGEDGVVGDDGGGGVGGTFVRVLLLRGRLAGAVLIGETGLEGTFEDLILDGIDVSFLGPRLLDPELDIEAIFD